MNQPARLALICLSLTTGCVLYDGECKDEFWADSGWDEDGWDDDGWDEEDGDDIAAGPDFALTPAEGVAGTTFITSLEAGEVFEYAQVSDVWFFGDVSLCTKAARADELILTLAIDAEAELGRVDMVVEMEDGERYLVEDALNVLGEDGQGLEDGGGADGGGADDGGAQDGGGSDDGGGEAGSGGSNPCG
jgi:hypothetical protein